MTIDHTGDAHSKVLVVGGGIGGLATALSLARSGTQVRVLEQADEFAEVGAGLQMGANALRVLDHLGVLDEAMETAVLPEFGILLDAITGEELTRLQLGKPYRERFGYPYCVMHRPDLLDALVGACRTHPLVELCPGHGVDEVISTGPTPRVRCENGSEYSGDIVIGADGLNSTLRRRFDDTEPICTGYSAYRGTVPAVSVNNGAGDDVLIWIGPNLHLVQYPIRGGELYNQVAVFGSPTYTDGNPDWGNEAELDERFSTTCEAVRAAVARIGRDRRWIMFEREPLPVWTEDHLTLLGDAAHPMLQYLGQGACQALEDAVVITGALAAHPTDLAAGLRDYESIRKPRTARCQSSAGPWGEVWHSEDPLVIGLRNMLFKKRAWDDYQDVDWMYDDYLTPQYAQQSAPTPILETS